MQALLQLLAIHNGLRYDLPTAPHHASTPFTVAGTSANKGTLRRLQAGTTGMWYALRVAMSQMLAATCE